MWELFEGTYAKTKHFLVERLFLIAYSPNQTSNIALCHNSLEQQSTKQVELVPDLMPISWIGSGCKSKV